jgi:hypothetical protein
MCGRYHRHVATPEGSPEGLAECLRPLFWDVRFADLSWPANQEYIVARVLQHGSLPAVRWLRARMPDSDLVAYLVRRRGRGLGARQLRFWQVLLSIPDEIARPWIDAARSGPWAQRTTT